MEKHPIPFFEVNVYSFFIFHSQKQPSPSSFQAQFEPLICFNMLLQNIINIEKIFKIFLIFFLVSPHIISSINQNFVSILTALLFLCFQPSTRHLHHPHQRSSYLSNPLSTLCLNLPLHINIPIILKFPLQLVSCCVSLLLNYQLLHFSQNFSRIYWLLLKKLFQLRNTLPQLLTTMRN